MHPSGHCTVNVAQPRTVGEGAWEARAEAKWVCTTLLMLHNIYIFCVQALRRRATLLSLPLINELPCIPGCVIARRMHCQGTKKI